MHLNEVVITKAIVERFSQKFLAYTEIDTAIVGAGPSGLTCAYYLGRPTFWRRQDKKSPSLNES